MAGHDQMFLNCSRCGLSIRARSPTMEIEHCPRCLARTQTLQPMFRSPMTLEMLRTLEPDGRSQRNDDLAHTHV